jgi:hypothetical protein
MGWVQEKIDEIGMERFLQDLIKEIDLMPNKEPYLWLLFQDLEMTMQDYEARND